MIVKSGDCIPDTNGWSGIVKKAWLHIAYSDLHNLQGDR